MVSKLADMPESGYICPQCEERMMEKEMKKKYKVYRITKAVESNGTRTYRSFVGETWAISERRAIVNIKYRIGFDERTAVTYYPGGCETRIWFEAVAEEGSVIRA